MKLCRGGPKPGYRGWNTTEWRYRIHDLTGGIIDVFVEPVSPRPRSRASWPTTSALAPGRHRDRHRPSGRAAGGSPTGDPGPTQKSP